MKKLINRLAKDFGLEISNTPQYSTTEYKKWSYVFYPGVRGSLINTAEILINDNKKDFVNVALDVDETGKFFYGIKYFDDYEKAKEKIKNIIMKIKEKKFKQKIKNIEQDFI